MSRLAQIVASSEGIPLYIERNGKPERVLFIPSAPTGGSRQPWPAIPDHATNGRN